MNKPVAVLFERFGPYHRARLAATSRRISVAAVEITARDATYTWDLDGRSTPFEMETLFPNGGHLSSGQSLLKAVRASLDRIQPMAVAVPGWSAPYAVAALSWCADRRVPAVLMSDSTTDDAPRYWWREKVKARLVRICRVSLVGGERHRTYLKRLGMAEERVFAGYDVVDNDHFAHGADVARGEQSAQRPRHSLPDRYFLASGRFVEKKNIPCLLEAYARYRRRAAESPWELVLLGDGELRDAVERRIGILGISNVVRLPGFKQYDELPIYYGLAGAFVHASTVEQWGLVVNEAMASGLPVIVSERCGCVPELLEHGRNGYTFNPSDAGELARLMGHVASDNCNRQAMGTRSREIIARWSPETFARGLATAVATACDAPPPEVGLWDRILLKGLVHR